MSRGRALGAGRLWKRNAKWVLDFREASGARTRRVLGTDKRTAERRRSEMIRLRDMELDGLGAIAGQDLELSFVVLTYAEDLKPRVTPRHHSQVESRLRSLLGVLGPKKMRDLFPGQVIAIRNSAVAKGSSHRTANLIVTTLQAALRWAIENGLIAYSPVDRIRKLPETRDHQRYRRRALTDVEIARFIEASTTDDASNDLRAALEGIQRVPQTPMWIAFIETGARYGELRQSCWGDVDFARAQLVLRAENTKSRKLRSVPIRLSLVNRLRSVRALHETVLGRLPTIADPIFLTPEGRSFPAPTSNAMRVFDRLLIAARIPKIDAIGEKLDLHALRTTAGTRMARSGVPLAMTQRVLGHSDPKLTAQAYIQLDASDLRCAVDLLPEIGGSTEPLSNHDYKKTV